MPTLPRLLHRGMYIRGTIMVKKKRCLGNSVPITIRSQSGKQLSSCSGVEDKEVSSACYSSIPVAATV
jgi:hypothetical protein